MKIVLFYITTSGENEARRLGEAAIEARLAACANVLPVQSLYRWNGAMQHDEENVLLLKTLPSHMDQLSDFIRSLHSYTLPCIMHWETEVNDDYGQWVMNEVTRI